MSGNTHLSFTQAMAEARRRRLELLGWLRRLFGRDRPHNLRRHIGDAVVTGLEDGFPAIVWCEPEPYRKWAIEVTKLGASRLIWTVNGSPLDVLLETEKDKKTFLTDQDRAFARQTCKKARLVIFNKKNEMQEYMENRGSSSRVDRFEISAQQHNGILRYTSRFALKQLGVRDDYDDYDIGYLSFGSEGTSQFELVFQSSFSSSSFSSPGMAEARDFGHLLCFPRKHTELYPKVDLTRATKENILYSFQYRLEGRAMLIDNLVKLLDDSQWLRNYFFDDPVRVPFAE